MTQPNMIRCEGSGYEVKGADEHFSGTVQCHYRCVVYLGID